MGGDEQQKVGSILISEIPPTPPHAGNGIEQKHQVGKDVE